MTKQEFMSKQKALVQNANRRLSWWLPVFFGLIFANIPLTRYVERNEELTWAGPALGVGLFVFLIGNLLFLAWFAKRQQKRFGLHCANCGKLLTGASAQIAVASGNCGYCGERLFSETPAAQ